MTREQENKVRRNAYKFYDKIVLENDGWDNCDIAVSAFYAGAEYALKNKYDELKDDAEKKNDKPNIVQFLKDNGVYEKFWYNLLNHKRGERLHKYFLSDFSNSNAISAAFIWSETPEGQYFWEKIYDKWCEQF
jgi:ATP-dependent exoDNAse (exonuclease V) beta subunit